MAVAIDNSFLADNWISDVQTVLGKAVDLGKRFQVHRVCVFVTILPFDLELWQQLQSPLDSYHCFERCLAKEEVLDCQADPDDDLGELEVLHHLRQQAAAVPILSSVISRRDPNKGATTLIGSALSPSIQARTQGRLLSSFQHHSIRSSDLHIHHPIPFSNSIRGKCRLLSRGSAQPGCLYKVRVQFPSYPGRLEDPIVWANAQADGHVVFRQVQWDVIDLFSRRTLPTSRPGKRRRTAFNPFLQVSHSPVVEDTSRGNPLHKYHGVRHRPDRKVWVAEMKPPKHKTKQDFGNFKSEAEAARAVDAAFYHYGKPHRLNFPHTSLHFLSTRSEAPPGLDEKAKVKFVKEEAKLLLAAIAATSPLHSTPTDSLQIRELSASPSHFRPLSEVSSPFSCSGPADSAAAVSRPQQWLDPDSICAVCSTGLQSNMETLDSVQNAEQGWDWLEDSSTLATPLNDVNFSACENHSMWLDSLIRSPPAPTCSRSPSPGHFQEGIAYALLEEQSI